MTVSYTEFLTTDDFSGYEDSEKYQKEWLPKVLKYREDLEAGILPEFTVELPGSIEKLTEDKFNPLKYLYENKLLTEKEFKITDTPAFILAEQIAKGELTAVETLKAFGHRAIISHQFTNCAMELFVNEGLARAQELDDYYKKNGKTVGPLHGIPISLKEQMNYRGKITHGGYVSKIDNVVPEHGITNQVLENLGAVFYVRTNQPQTLMHLDSNNNFTGLSKNPFNLILSSGGSSSGEGAIVGFGGSAIGVGSDIGGSIRAPAAYSGCHGLRPTTKRISTFGGISGGAGQESVPAVVGPMARSVTDLEIWMKSYINVGKPWNLDQNCIPIPWREVSKPEPKSLTIAVIYDDGLVKPSPPIARGLKEVVAKLEAAGVKIVKFEPFDTKLAYDTVHKMYACDGNYAQRELLAGSGEPLKKLTKWSLSYGDGAKAYEVAENRKLNMIRDKLRQDYTDYLNDNEVDFILSPTYNNVAPKSEEVYNWSYTSLFNILDLPTLAFQTGIFQDPAKDVWGPEHADYKYRSKLEELECSNYNPEDFVGAPVGLQLSGRRYFDEEVLAAGKTIVDDILKCDLFDLF
ncbi:putative amidase FG08078 [[Candida] railenensis]|uniref:amidase n=1 Tax=[Candida] railenensis TaxID=45579 RepID=A0A9P0W1G2_9ASCO|nr:putative amidase FG08078 [[Candida] railenensis]